MTCMNKHIRHHMQLLLMNLERRACPFLFHFFHPALPSLSPEILCNRWASPTSAYITEREREASTIKHQ